MRRRKLADDERAAVYVEFLVVFMPIFLLFLGMVQTSMLFTAKLVVDHSAYRAARSAIVILPDNPSNYGDAPVNEVDFNEIPTSDVLPRAITSFADFLGFYIPTNLFSTGNARLNMVRLAAFVPLIGLAPPPGYLSATAGVTFGEGEADGSVLAAIGFTGNGADGQAGRLATGVLWAVANASVTFPTSPTEGVAATSGSLTPASHVYQQSESMTARVAFQYPCMVPAAANLMCKGWNNMGDQTHSDGPSGAGRDELNAAIARGGAIAASRGLYYVLRGQSTMTYQGASYTYHP